MTLVATLLLLTFTPAAPASAGRVADVRAEVKKLLPQTVSLCRWLHANPELSGQEVATAARMAKELRALGMEVHEKIGGTGVVGIMKSGRNPKGRLILVRADMDALPVHEETGLPFASKNPGVMHACGHDIHMSNAIGALSVLRALDKTWDGTVLAVLQPAEETGHGARDMLADKKMKRLLKELGKPALALAIHDASDLPAGSVGLLSGYTSANVDSVDLVIHGQGGHGAKPQQTIDPVLIAADVVVTLQSIVSRRIKPGERAVVTVGKIEAGTKHNIIPARATLLLTVRSYGDEMRQLLLDEIRRVATHVARAHRAPRDPEMTIRDEFTPSGYNDPAWTERLRELFAAAIDAGHVRGGEPSTGGEDFSRYGLQLKIPAVMYRLGAASPAALKKLGPSKLPQLHSGGFKADFEPTLRTGMTTLALAILEGLAGP